MVGWRSRTSDPRPCGGSGKRWTLVNLAGVRSCCPPDQLLVADLTAPTFEVTAVGPKVEDVKKGDRVIYGMYAGEKIEPRDWMPVVSDITASLQKWVAA